MSEKKAYPLRINVAILAEVQRWADDELRSVNAQIEYALRDALRRAGRLKSPEIPTPIRALGFRTAPFTSWSIFGVRLWVFRAIGDH